MIRSYALLGLTILLTPAVARPAEPLPTVEEIAKVWETQGEKYKSYRIVWKEKVHRTGYMNEDFYKGLKAMLEAEMRFEEFPRPVFVNRNEYHFENHYTFIRRGVEQRADKKGVAISLNREQATPDNLSIVYDGIKIREAVDHGLNAKKMVTDFDRDFNRGFSKVFDPPEFGRVLMGAQWDAGKCFRFKTRTFTVEAHGPVQGMNAIRVIWKNEALNQGITYVLIPQLDFAIVEYDFRIDQKDLKSYRATFDPKRSVIPFVPLSSTCERFEDGRLTYSQKMTYESVAINEPIPAKTFELDFPPYEPPGKAPPGPGKPGVTVPGKPAPEKK